jgi:hypothetical protein
VSEGNYGRYEKGGNGLQVTPSLYGIDFLFDQRDKVGGDLQAVLAYWFVHARHMADSLYFLYLLLKAISDFLVSLPTMFLVGKFSSPFGTE